MQVPNGAAGSESSKKGTPSQRDERFNVPAVAEDELGCIFTARKSDAHPWSGLFASDRRAARIFRGTNVRQALRRAEAAAITIKVDADQSRMESA